MTSTLAPPLPDRWVSMVVPMTPRCWWSSCGAALPASPVPRLQYVARMCVCVVLAHMTVGWLAGWLRCCCAGWRVLAWHPAFDACSHG